MNDAPPPDRETARHVKTAPHAWVDALDRADSDVAAGRVHSIDLEALCQEIEAEAATMDAAQRQPPVIVAVFHAQADILGRYDPE